MPDLKSCPFCGGEAVLGGLPDTWATDNDGRYLVECDNCGATAPSRGRTKDEARASWNTRHPAPLSEENVEVVARAIACARDKRLYGIERSPDEGWNFLTDYARSEFISDARAAITALSTTQESNRG